MFNYQQQTGQPPQQQIPQQQQVRPQLQQHPQAVTVIPYHPHQHHPQIIALPHQPQAIFYPQHQQIIYNQQPAFVAQHHPQTVVPPLAIAQGPQQQMAMAASSNHPMIEAFASASHQPPVLSATMLVSKRNLNGQRKSSSTSTTLMSGTPDPAIGHLLHNLSLHDPSLNASKDEEDAEDELNLDDLDPEEEKEEIQELLRGRELNALMKAYNVILFCNQEQCPCVSDVVSLAKEVMDEIRPFALMIEECRELYAILTTPHINNLLLSHDIVANRDYLPQLEEIPYEVDEDEETVKIVQLVKSQDCAEGLQDEQGNRSAEPIVGATIKADEATGRILIARVMHGGAADRSGLISVGDEVVEVNGILVEGKTPNDVHKILQSAETTITFKLIPSENRAVPRESRVRLRALFEYDPQDDKYIPCKEAGLPFKRGEILHIVSQDDPYWWQARKEQDRNMRAGLIPSRALQERRIIQERDERAKLLADDQESEDFDREEIATYEEVARLFPRSGFFRSIVLVGPPGVGRNELKRRIIDIDTDRFRMSIPHTSRETRPGEVHGKDYFFDSRDKIQAGIDAGTFIEHGEFKGNLYGTSIDGIRELLDAGLQPVLNPHYQALRKLRSSLLKPYVIYVKPPPFERLKETRHSAHAKSTFTESSDRAFTDDEFRTMVRAGEKMERAYGHWFDAVFVNDDLNETFEQIAKSIFRLDQDAQWVPTSWVQ